jgi:signal transduction histidine kinase
VTFQPHDLRPLSLFEGLPDEELAWFCAHGEHVVLDKGEHMFERGEPATALWIVVRGIIQGFEEIGGQWLLVATTEAGEPTGMLPFSRMTHYPRYTVAAEPSEVLRVDVSLFRQMLDMGDGVARRLVARMSDRVRQDVRLEQQSEKMVSLGRLSAGLAHELNNPAAAVRRAASRLADHRKQLPGLVSSLLRHQIGEDGLQRLVDLRSRTKGPEDTESTALERSAREEELADKLEELGLAEPWDVAANLDDAGVTVGDLDDLAAHLPLAVLPDALTWLGVGIESDQLIREIHDATARISDLVSAIGTYSHMDRSREHKPTDVREGLDNTLTILAHKLRQKSIRLMRDYAEDVPLIPANAGELNQVWTNLLDNAADAVPEGGEIVLRVRKNDAWVEVEIGDDGPGIPEQLRARIFEPFFTTKDVGVGTGLGLGIANRIVKTHRGHIEVRSRPGETVMCVRLPLSGGAGVRGAGSRCRKPVAVPLTLLAALAVVVVHRTQALE